MNFVEKNAIEAKCVTVTVKDEVLKQTYSADEISNNNINVMPSEQLNKIDTIIEYNGNIDDDDLELETTANENYITNNECNRNDV